MPGTALSAFMHGFFFKKNNFSFFNYSRRDIMLLSSVQNSDHSDNSIIHLTPLHSYYNIIG